MMWKCMKRYEDERMALRKNKVDWFDFLPDDILSYILKRLPDAFLRYKAKYVCKRWFNISTNRILLDDASFILERSRGIHTARLVGLREGQQGLEVKEQNLDIPFVKIKSWYNEFLLITTDHSTVIVFNQITNERTYLPQCHTICRPHYRCGVTLFFDRFKGVYKVVHFFIGPPFQCHILILGSKIVPHVCSLWKKMEVAWDADFWQNYPGALVSVQVEGRYLHCDVYWSDYLVSVDTVKEEIIQMSLPRSNDRPYNFYSIFKMGGFLALIDGVCRGIADIWILKDFQRMKWEKLQSMTFPDYYIGKYPVACSIYPVCGVISKRYIIFINRKSGDKYCSYDLKDGVVKELNIHIEYGDRYLVRSSAPNFI